MLTHENSSSPMLNSNTVAESLRKIPRNVSTIALLMTGRARSNFIALCKSLISEEIQGARKRACFEANILFDYFMVNLSRFQTQPIITISRSRASRQFIAFHKPRIGEGIERLLRHIPETMAAARATRVGSLNGAAKARPRQQSPRTLTLFIACVECRAQSNAV
jgi:hypothetical protein